MEGEKRASQAGPCDSRDHHRDHASRRACGRGKGAGFLSPEAIEDLLRCKLASDRLKRLQQARIRLSSRPEEAMTQEEIQAEIKAYRQEQRIAALRQHQLPTKRS